MAVTLVTPKFRVFWPQVFKPKPFADQEPKYSVVAVYPKGTDLSALRDAVAKECLAAGWGADPKKWPKFKHPILRQQTELVEKDEQGEPKLDAGGKPIQLAGSEAGGFYQRYSNKERPIIRDPSNKMDILEASEFYMGCWARAHVNVSAYDNKFGKGVSFYLNFLQKVGDGDALGKRTRVEDAFTPIEGANGEAAESADELFG